MKASDVRDRIAEIRELEGAGRAHDALVLCRALVRGAPTEATAWSRLGIVSHRLGLLEESEQALRKSISLNPHNPNDWSNLSVVLRDTGRYDEAETCARKAIQSREDNGTFWLNLSTALCGQKKWSEALHACQQSIRYDPRDAEAWNNLGTVEQRLGNFAAAQAAYERCLGLAPGLSEGTINYAFLLA